MMRKTYSFRTQLILPVLGIVSIALVIGMGLILSIVTREFSRQNEKYTLSAFAKSELELGKQIDTIARGFTSLIEENNAANILEPDRSNYLTYMKDQVQISRLFDKCRDFSIVGLVTDNTAFISRPGKSFSVYEADNERLDSPLFQQISQMDSGYGTAYLSEFTSYPEYITAGAGSEGLTGAGGSSNQQEIRIIYFIRKIRHFNKELTLILGLEETLIRQTYLQLEQGSNYIYIVDGDGYIISSNESDSFGKPLSFYRPAKDGALSFQHRIGGSEYQIIEYPLNYSDWTIINQYPTWQYKRDVNRISGIIFLISACSLITIAAAVTLAIRKLSSPLNRLSSQIKAFSSNGLATPVPEETRITELEILSGNFVKMANDIHELMEVQKEEEEKKNQLRIQTLMAQINPHFIYNTLNTIKTMAELSGCENVATMILHLCQYISPAFRIGKNRWTCAEEYAFLHDYLYILEIRFGTKMEFETKFDLSLKDSMLPRFLIQPLIENCISHAKKPQQVLRIWISVAKADDGETLEITVTDNGSGIAPDILMAMKKRLRDYREDTIVSENRHLGLLNIKQRLCAYYPETHTLILESESDRGTKITITFPLKADD